MEVQKKKTMNWFHIGIATYIMTLCFIPETALAAPWDGVTDGLIDSINSNFARSAAVLAVMGLGIAGFCGKLSWRWAGSIIGGIVCIFGAASIVDLFSNWAS